MRSHLTLEQRLWKHIDPCRTDGCWIWTGPLSQQGYGHFKVAGRQTFAHRLAYELLVGPIPEGLELDHVLAKGCVNHDCVNVFDHLEPVTHAENVRRGNHWKRRVTCCPQGHPYDPGNTYIRRDKSRGCRACNAARMRQARARNA